MPVAVAQGPTGEQPDKYTWLEDIHGDKSMEWVKAENARTAAVMEKQKPFARLDEDALKVLDSPDKLAFPSFEAGWCTTPGATRIMCAASCGGRRWRAISRRSEVGDGDRLRRAGQAGQAELGRPWTGLHGAGRRALHGGIVCRAAKMRSTFTRIQFEGGQFVEGGFVMPRGKQRLAWLDKDTLLIGRDWGPGTMSEAGYPITVRKWKSGTPLESSVKCIAATRKTMATATIPLCWWMARDTVWR